MLRISSIILAVRLARDESRDARGAFAQKHSRQKLRRY